MIKKVFHHIRSFSLLAFISTNRAVKFTVATFLLRPANAVLLLLTMSVVLLFNSLTTALDFTLFGTEYTFGSGLRTTIGGAADASWRGLADLIGSYEPSTPLGFPLEILTELLAGLMLILGIVVPFVFNLLITAISLLFHFGAEILIETLSWFYLAGLSLWLYERFFQPANNEETTQ